MVSKDLPELSAGNTTNQHWVPWFLLKGFGRKGQADQLYTLDKQTGKIDVRSVKDVASKQRLLTELDDQLMNEIETRANPVIGQIRKGRLDLKEQDRQALDQLVFALILNDPYSGVNEPKMREKVISKVSRDYEAAIIRQGGLINSQLLSEQLDGLFPHDYLNIAMASENKLSLTALGLMGLEVHKAAKEFVVIGDSPTLVARGTIYGERSLLYPGSEVALPINSELVLVYSWTTQRNLIQEGSPLSRQQVRFLGQGYYHHTNGRYIFGRTHDAFRNVRERPAQRASPEHSAKFKDGWLIMRGITKRIYDLREQADQMDQRRFEDAARELVSNAREATR